MGYSAFFSALTGSAPYSYQERLAGEPWPDLLDVPTGLGKTSAVTLAWAWKRGLRPGGVRLAADAHTPRRLVWCLPMRVLVEQANESVCSWLSAANHLGAAGEGKVSVHLLMGGEDDLKTWAEWPEEDMLLIGTQDMLLSRALMRGYGMSRYQWPVHFAFLHNDALWVFDEVQLMGAGLATSAQLAAFRHDLPLGAGSRSLWMSATLNADWLATVDLRGHLPGLSRFSLSEGERSGEPVRKRREALKRLAYANLALAKEGVAAYAKSLAEEVLAAHAPGAQTIVIVNTVGRAQAVFTALDKLKPAAERLLVHARYRARERAELNRKLSETPDPAGPGRIVVATQAIEAGVDISSKTLFTELAPWASLVQRFGRCNRYGEWNDTGGANVLWIDLAQDQSGPYDDSDLAAARAKLERLQSASPADLPATTEAAPLSQVLRRRDFLDLFNTDPDLSGFDTDISPYIRDADDLDVQVFWRDLTGGVEGQPQPAPEEICRASLSQLGAYLKKRKGEVAAWRWDALAGEWKPLRGGARPGLVLMLDARRGGYDTRLGFDPDQDKLLVPVLIPAMPKPTADAYDGDSLSRQSRPVELVDHLADVEQEVRDVAAALGLASADTEAVARAGRWHDVGKAHDIFRATLTACREMSAQADRLWAKSPCRGCHARPHFRHELASMLAWISHRQNEPDADLIAYLIAAHHGKVRMSLRAVPEEQAPPQPERRYARGIWEGDSLPSIELPAEAIPETTLRLDLMEFGEGDMGPSWTDCVQRLLDAYGPFRLAWLEALVRIADWRASKKEQEDRT
ncbi:MAG: hypothetical protein EFKGCFLK_01881 [Rhodocyclaceae bacterium]|nr:MAG: CRISPR-associated helicase Cas3' [Rhodocyclaceae bacterium]MBV6408295.1 hypothetical protein [Rhodocyclaceae bacterium]CAG0931560.1 CRISPR-associated endonuclease/helicase Cas3 [Rhodocyclaceae bacterium]